MGNLLPGQVEDSIPPEVEVLLPLLPGIPPAAVMEDNTLVEADLMLDLKIVFDDSNLIICRMANISCIMCM